MLTSLESLLLTRAGLLKPPPMRKTIHVNTLNTAMDVCGYWDARKVSKEEWKKRVDTQAYDPSENSPNGVSALCSHLLESPKNLDSLYSRKEFILSNIYQFNVDQVLLILYTLHLPVKNYSTWFRVNCDDLTVLLMSCHRFLLAEVKNMSVEQLNSAMVIFDSLRKRYPEYSMSNSTLRREIFKRLMELSVEQNMSKGSPVSMKGESFDSDIQKLPTRVHRIYVQIYPYYEAIKGRLMERRCHVKHLVSAATIFQRQHTLISPFPLEEFNSLCLRLKRLLLDKDLYPLDCTLNFIRLLESNSRIFPNAAKLESQEIKSLVVKLKELAIDSFLVLPSYYKDDVLPEVVEQSITKILSSTLELPTLECLSSSMKAIKDCGFLSTHITILFLPYIANNLRLNPKDPNTLSALLPSVSPMGISAVPFWVIYFSALENSLSINACKDTGGLTSLCNGISDLLKIMYIGVSGGELHHADEGEVTRMSKDLQLDIENDMNCQNRSYIKDVSWLKDLDDVVMVNVTDIDSMDNTSSLRHLMQRRYKIDIESFGSIHFIANKLQKIEATIGSMVKLFCESQQHLGYQVTRESPGMIPEGGDEDHQDHVNGVESLFDYSLVSLTKSYRAMGQHIALFERMIENSL
ncbi:hypothetical protein BgAZ_400160 [Babesia gibsoni]|uniref:Uncharacterized protein n=1 Tax=Babesia gibsoni TaxID=33632 RepID=A0AAD8LNH0_BABGI|nr:hypothetical protein BgAZ_400160 [Babesia gibsoni]